MTSPLKTLPAEVKDRLGRPIHDLRVSVIDRCNFRCTYCMPEQEYSKFYTFLPKHAWLSFDEIVRLVRVFAGLGTKKIRITGGEPLLRPNIDRLVKALKAVDGIEDIALTTNGVLLVEQADLLYKAGLGRLTVSLDSLDNGVCRRMNGGRGSVREILDGITEAERCGFRGIKINTVVEKGVNDHTLLELAEYFKGSGHTLRFLEYMDVGNCNHWDISKVIPSKQILAAIHAKYPLVALEAGYFGEVASRYAYADGSGEIGFISSVTQPFCGSCTRARVSTDGKLYTCLFASKGHDLRHFLRDEKISDEALTQAVSDIWKNRGDKYSEERGDVLAGHTTAHKVEMFQIGG